MDLPGLRDDLFEIENVTDHYNPIQTWRAEGSSLPFRDLKTYTFSYSIIAPLRDRYGDPFFQRFFVRLHERTMSEGRARERTDDEIVALMSDAAREDLRPFFVGELGVKLDDEPVLAAPEAARDQPTGDNPPLD